MKKVLVTGGAGFIGSHVAETLLIRGNGVVLLDDFSNRTVTEGNMSNLRSNPACRVHRSDVRDKRLVREIFLEEEIGKVIHLAAKVGVRASFRKQQLYHEVNVGGTKNLLDIANEFKVENFVFASSSSVYGTNEKVPFSEDDEVKNQISPYARTKRECELLCREYYERSGSSTACLRFFTVYGPRGRPDMAPYKFTRLISRCERIDVYGDGTSQRDYTFIEDIVEGVVSALNCDFDFEIINLGNEKPIELRRLISLIEENVGKSAIIKKAPLQEGDVPITFADISKARRILGFNPKTTIEDGIKKMVEWYRREHHDTL